MRTLFETSWARDGWSPNLGQAAAPGNVFGQIAQAAGSAATGFFQAEAAEEARKAAEAKAAADAAAAQARALTALQAQAAQPQKILGMDPTTAAIVGVATLAAIIGGVMLLAKNK